MRKFSLFNWLRRDDVPQEADAISRSIDESLEATSKRLNAIDVDTAGQWRRLHLAMGKNQNAATVSRNIFRSGLLRPGLAFALAVIVLVALILVRYPRPSTKTYATSRGEQETIRLVDSTEVTLNHTSQLTTHLGAFDKERRVSLVGEAYFHVRRNGTPFILSTDVGTVVVLGTEFNVLVRDGRLEVGVLSGSVKVSINRKEIDKNVILQNNQIITCRKDEVPGTPEALSFSEYPGWMHGKLSFYRTDLLSVCKELDARFNAVIDIESTQLQSETITGTIDGRNVESALESLTRLTGNSYRREKSAYIIY